MSTLSSNPTLSPARQVLARSEQVAMVYRLLPGGIGASVGVAILLAGGLYGHVGEWHLVIWLGTVVFVSAVRLLSLRAWRCSRTPAQARWVRYFYAGAAAAGLSWGLAGFCKC
jgi:hypothetical protein